VSFNKNSFFCVTDQSVIHNIPVSGGEFPFPEVEITDVNTASVSGTATPNSSIELFYSDHCGTCSPETYFASTTADASGNWSYNGTINGSVIASATINGNTSEFTRARIDVANIKIINACGALGSITGAVVHNTKNVKWVNKNGDIVGTTPDLLNVPPGDYKLIVDNGSCGDASNYYTIAKGTLHLDATTVVKKDASCGQADGAIKGLKYNGSAALNWFNADGNVVGNNADLVGVSAGVYTLKIKPYDNTCAEFYGPIIIKNATGPNIDQTSALIKETNCGQTTGSITGIKATGTGALKYSWKDGAQKEIATTLNLVGQPAGNYTLQVTDESQCGPVYTSTLTIPELNGISLNDDKAVITVSSCSGTNGSVRNISATGATAFQWLDATRNVVGTAIDLQNVASGDYTLIASNNYGCGLTKTYHIGTLPSTQFPVYAKTITNTCFGQRNGSIIITGDALVKSARWVDHNGATAGTGLAINNVGAGTYQLYLTDANGCENFYDKYEVQEIPQLKIVSGSEQIINDNCTLKTGAIKNVQISGGTQPYSYSWKDNSGKIISSSADAGALNAGTYILTVNDALNCQSVSATYSVQDQDNVIASPVVNDVHTCSPGNVALTVTNLAAGLNYRVYDTETGKTVVAENSTGVFRLPVQNNRNYYVSGVSGSCESVRVMVKVSVGLSVADIPNAFTPNDDGVNDYWKIPGIENSPSASVKIFNRYGKEVFQSIGYTHPFDGKLNGQDLPNGSYYYIIDMGAVCKLLSGTLTIIR
jgi:gliding motility-associated-like protein